MIAQFVIIQQIPLPARVLIRPTVTFAREVDPFGVTEFVAHEVEITAIACRHRDEPNHFVQGDSAVCDIIFVTFFEVPIHIGVNQPEDNRLIADESLVVAFGVRDGFFVCAAIGHFPENRRRFPIFVALFFDQLDPEIGDVHSQAIIETEAAVLELTCEAGHTADIFGDSDGVGLDLVNHFIRQHEVANGVIVLVTVEIIAVTHESFAESVAVIKHRRDAVEPEAVEVEFLEPIFAIRQQEMNHVIFSVIETEAVPSGVFVAVAFIEELIWVAGEITETFDFIFDGVTVNDVHDNAETHLVSGVDQLFKFVGSTAAA